MFDAMVSIAFNAGISGLRNSEFIVGLKDTDLSNTEDLLKVAEKIKTARLKDNNSGLITRRLGEYNWFIRDLMTKV
jgi:GH24 family phage-related lysozyme (muramidase)